MTQSGPIEKTFDVLAKLVERLESLVEA
jgi:hypothetical protein